MRRRRVRRGEGFAVELCVDRYRAHLVDHRKLAQHDVHARLDGELPRRLQDGQARRHRARAAGSHKPPRVEHEHAAARVAEGQLHGRKPFGRVVRVGAARADRVQVERQLDPAARHRHRLGERDDVHEARHEVQHVLVVGQGQVVGEARALKEPLVARVDDQCTLALALARRAAVLDHGAHFRLQLGAEGGRLCGVGRHLVGHPDLALHALPLALHDAVRFGVHYHAFFRHYARTHSNTHTHARPHQMRTPRHHDARSLYECSMPTCHPPERASSRVRH